MKKILYVYGGPDFHPTKWAGEQLAGLLDKNRYTLEATDDLDAFTRLEGGQYAGVVVYATGFHNDLTPPREAALLGFIREGGGFLGIHSASDSFRGSRPYIDMLNAEFLTHPHQHEFPVDLAPVDHPITRGLASFKVWDEMYHLQPHSHFPDRCTLLASTVYEGQLRPLAFTRDYGKGRVAYLANGHTTQSWAHPTFQAMLTRSVDWITRC